jgi:nickel-dependent lactate racemase
MDIKLAYGRNGLTVTLPDMVDVLKPRFIPGLTDEQIERALFIPCRSLEQTVSQLQEKYGSQARICVIPEGPQTIPYLRGDVWTANNTV